MFEISHFKIIKSSKRGKDLGFKKEVGREGFLGFRKKMWCTCSCQPNI